MVNKVMYSSPLKELPTWFYDWWQKYGGSLKILPKPILKLYKTWADIHSIIYNIEKNKIFDGLSCTSLQKQRSNESGEAQ